MAVSLVSLCAGSSMAADMVQADSVEMPPWRRAQKLRNQAKESALSLSTSAVHQPTPQCAPVPSLGSTGHSTGACKPCVFLHTKGCASGTDCQFCHLCGPDEKKQRQKAKRMHFQQLRASHAKKFPAAVSPYSVAITPPQQTAQALVAPNVIDQGTARPSDAPSAQYAAGQCNEMRTSLHARRPNVLQPLDEPAERPYVVRNTFIETPFGMPSLLDDAVQDRACSSCPASKVGKMQLTVNTQFDDSESTSTGEFPSTLSTTPQSFPSTPWPATPEPQLARDVDTLAMGDFALTSMSAPHGLLNAQWPSTSDFPEASHSNDSSLLGVSLFSAPAPFDYSASAQTMDMQCVPPNPENAFQPCGQMVAMPFMDAPVEPSTAQVPAYAGFQCTMPQVEQSSTIGSHVLSLAEVIEGPDRIESEPSITTSCPSVGSLGHSFGTCKPCGFFYKAGCSSGAQCSYCHLCDPGEKKRRQREKREALRNVARGKARTYAAGGA